MSFPLILVSPGASSPSTWPTLEELYVLVAEEIGGYATAAVSGSVPTGEPGRWVALNDFIDDEDARDEFSGGWIRVKTGALATTQRRLRQTGYEGPYGAMALTRTLSANLAPGVQVQVTHPLPIRSIRTTRGLVDFVRDATDIIWTEVRIPFVGADTRLYNLSGYSMLLQQVRLDGLYQSYAATDAPYRLADIPEIIHDGATVTLVTPYAFGSDVTLYLRAFIPVSRLTYDGSAWGYSTTGLVNDSDQVAAPREWVLPVACLKAYQYLTRYTMADRTLDDATKAARLDEIMRRRRTYAEASRNVMVYLLPQLTPASTRAIMDGTTDTSHVSEAIWGTGWP